VSRTQMKSQKFATARHTAKGVRPLSTLLYAMAGRLGKDEISSDNYKYRSNRRAPTGDKRKSEPSKSEVE
jgi:hypothetical protein